MNCSLSIPGTSIALHRVGERMASDDGSAEYPIVHDVPVLFPTNGQSSFPAYQRSCELRDPRDPWQVDTLAINDASKAEVKAAIAAGNSPIDPCVSRLVLATNGMAYAHQVGKLGTYPIPRFRLTPVGGRRRLLDLGCSWGRWCIAANQAGFEPTGIDPSLGAVLAARRVAKELGALADFVCGDARQLPFPDGEFDVVHSYSVLQHFSDADVGAALAEAARVLKPGGYAFIQLANALGIRSLYHLARRGGRAPQNFEVRYRRPAQLRAIAPALEKAELHVDCFFGLGLQPSDRDFYTTTGRVAIGLSEFLRSVANRVGVLTPLADSLYLRAVKPGE